MAEITGAVLAKQKAENPSKFVPMVRPLSAQDKEKIAAEKILQGMNPARAVKEAGFNFSQTQAQKYGDKLRERYNDRLVAAYEQQGLTPEYLAEKQIAILDDEKTRPGDKLKAIEQILNITGGFAPKQIEQTTVTFEQAVFNIAQTVNLSRQSASELKDMLDVIDAEVIS